MSLETFQCSNCSAPVDYDTDSGDKTVKCNFCGTNILVPESLVKKVDPVQTPPVYVATTSYSEGGTVIDLSGDSNKKARGCIIWLVIGIVVITGIVPLLITGVVALPFLAIPFLVDDIDAESFNTVIEEIAEEAESGSGEPITIPGVQDAAPSGFASVVNTFGSEGTGPGFFTDARNIAVDGEGRIYVGEYQDGRVQVFSGTGEFLTVWNLGNETPLTGLSADRSGNVYAVYQGYIHRYNAETGENLGQLQYTGDWGFDDVTVTADGGLVASWYKNSDDIVWFNSDGIATQTITEAISSQAGESELDTSVAVDGLGNVYALGSFTSSVFKFGPDGRYINRFGGDGDGDGQFRAPQAIAVDNQGRVYVSDIWSIQVFDETGRYIDRFTVDGPAFGMVFTNDNHLLVAARTQVIEYVLNE